jgi:tetratricopeptide (TPR) repeat protein
VLTQTLIQQCRVLLVIGDPSTTPSLAQEALSVSREEGYLSEAAWSLALLAEGLLRAGQLDEAEPLLLEGIVVGRQSGDVGPVNQSLRVLARLHWMRGDLTRARRTVQEAIELVRRVRFNGALNATLRTLGNLASAEQDWTAAEDWYRQSLNVESRGTRIFNVANSLRCFAIMCVARGDPRRAVRIFGATRAWEHYDEMFRTMPRDLPSAASDSIAAARQMLGEDAFAAAWADGQSLTVEQAIIEILSEHPQQVHP